MKPKLKTVVVWSVLVVVFVTLLRLLEAPPQAFETYETFTADVAEGRVSEVRVIENQLHVTRWDGPAYSTLGFLDAPLVAQLTESGVVLAWGEESHPMRTVLIVGVPVVLLIALFVHFLRKGSQGGVGNILSLANSRARLIEDATVTFADVGGLEEAKDHLADLIDFLKNPERWSDAGVRLPRGVLLEGPPGCGKTLLARAVAGETDASFYLVSASEFIEMFVGVGAARVRDMFEIAAKEAPSVIFIDELDAVGRKRGSGVGAAHDEREQTLNQILVCMDGFERHDRVVVIAATNRADILDAALCRPGRFDRRIEIGPLSDAQRRAVIEIHTHNKKLAEDVDLAEIARRTEGWCGAQLEALANEAGLLAVRRATREQGRAAVVEQQDFLESMRPTERRGLRFDRVDSLIMESTTQLAQATGRTRVRVTLLEGTAVEGQLVWADASFIKVAVGEEGSALVPKSMIKTLEALAGTEWADEADVQGDTWAGRSVDLA